MICSNSSLLYLPCLALGMLYCYICYICLPCLALGAEPALPCPVDCVLLMCCFLVTVVSLLFVVCCSYDLLMCYFVVCLSLCCLLARRSGLLRRERHTLRDARPGGQMQALASPSPARCSSCFRAERNPVVLFVCMLCWFLAFVCYLWFVCFVSLPRTFKRPPGSAGSRSCSRSNNKCNDDSSSHNHNSRGVVTVIVVTIVVVMIKLLMIIRRSRSSEWDVQLLEPKQNSKKDM